MADAPPIIEVIPPLTWVEFQISLAADWDDAFPQLVEGDPPMPIDISSAQFDLWVRPAFDHATVFAHFTNGDGITIDDGPNGLASVFMSRADLINYMPAGRWQHYLTLTEAGGKIREIWRGPISVHPARISSVMLDVTANSYGVRPAGRWHQGPFVQAA